jgi:hypothetical protein
MLWWKEIGDGKFLVINDTIAEYRNSVARPNDNLWIIDYFPPDNGLSFMDMMRIIFKKLGG